VGGEAEPLGPGGGRRGLRSKQEQQEAIVHGGVKLGFGDA
jgi:hypothetical protein